MPRHLDPVILVCDLAKQISDPIQDLTIKEWHSSLAMLNLCFQPLQI